MSSRLGAGSFGTVYEAQDTKTDTTVAIKKVDLGKSGAPALVQRELAILEYVTSQAVPHTVRLLDHVQAQAAGDTYLYMVFNLIPGQSLGDLLRFIRSRRAARPGEMQTLLFGLMRQLVSVSRNLNALCVIHRDLKPSNLLVSQTFNLTVVDFGAACIKPDCKQNTYPSSALCNVKDPSGGTMGYIAQEAMESNFPDPYYWENMDLYPVGLILSEIATGIVTEEDWMQNEGPAYLTGQASLDQLLQAMTSKNPLERPTWAAAMVELDGIINAFQGRLPILDSNR